MAGRQSNTTSNVGCLSFQLIALKDIDGSLSRLKGSPKLGKLRESRRNELEPYLNKNTSLIFVEMQVGASRVYKSKSKKLHVRGESLACIFDEFFSINLHVGDLSHLTASQRNPLINIRLFCLQRKNVGYPILLGSCKIPFIHLNESMVEENVQVRLNSNFFALFEGTPNAIVKPTLQCKVQWSMSMSQNDFDAILLKEVVSENVRFSSHAADIVHNESLSLSASNENFLRFIVASEEMFNVVDLVLDVLLWQRPAITTLLLIICNCLCLYGLSFAVVGPLLLACSTLWFFVNPISYLSRHFTKEIDNSNNNNINNSIRSSGITTDNLISKVSNDSSKNITSMDKINRKNDNYTPRSLRRITLSEKLHNFKSIQNFMKLFSDLVDGIFYFFEVQLNDPLIRIKARTTIITGVIITILFLMYVPTHVIWLLWWWVFFLFGNPYVHAVFAIIRFKFYRMKEKVLITHNEYIHEAEKFDNQRDKAFIVTEYTRWWVGAGWKPQSFNPIPMEKVSLPEHLTWKGLWEVDLYDDDHEYEYNSGFAGDNDWHEIMKSSDFLRRRRWIRRVKKANRSLSNDSNSPSNYSNGNNVIHNEDKVEGDVVEFVIYENERWWVGTGFRHKFWPHEKVFKFTDADGNSKKMHEIDEVEEVLQSDGNSHWIDHWHIVDDGWHYATDFSDLKKFKRKDRMGTWDYCRRRKWVRHLKKKV
eukprot:g5554.t1